MKKLGVIVAVLAITGAAVYFMSVDHSRHGNMAGTPAADAVRAGQLTISGATARFTIAGRPGAVHLSISNAGEADRLVGARSALAQRAELHTHDMTDGIMKMRAVEAIGIAAGATTQLKSGGDHIMLFGVTELPEPGTGIPVTLVFENAGDVDVSAVVTDATAHDHQ